MASAAARLATAPDETALRVAPSALNRLKKLGFSAGEITEIVAPRRTLDRRRKQGERLTLAESDRVHRLERIMQQADRVLGSVEKANLWLRRPNRALDGAVPIDLLKSETGAHMVSDILGRIEFGLYS
ncbi:MAG: DUF2384 domain-containing protein [Nitratireductor sp.]|nr:DUF2384 domain-containing protein [Nitratireductor sp.]